MKTVDTDIVWGLLKEDLEAADIPQDQISYLEPHFKGVSFSEELLASPVGLQSVLDSKIAVMQHLLDEKVISNAPDMSGEEHLVMVAAENMLRALVGELRVIAANVPRFLEENGVTESEVILSPRLGLNEVNRVLYQEGSFTVADLLMSQPNIIFQNKNS